MSGLFKKLSYRESVPLWYRPALISDVQAFPSDAAAEMDAYDIVALIGGWMDGPNYGGNIGYASILFEPSSNLT